MSLADLRATRSTTLDDGARAARQRAVDADRALSALAAETLGPQPDVAIVAVGGYGRGELSPYSDIDLLLLVRPRSDVSKATLRGLLYPLWDAGWQVGHAVRAPKEAIERTAQDLDSATSLLSARLVAGDADLFSELDDRLRRWTTKEGRVIVRRLVDALNARLRAADRAGWVLAPDLKEDVGGLRDVHHLGWLATVAGTDEGLEEVAPSYELLLAVREALHAEASRKLDRIRIDLQGRVAVRLQLESADDLMARVHAAARAIEYRGARVAEVLAERVIGGPKRSGASVAFEGGIRLDDGVLSATGEAEDVHAALELIAVHSTTGRPIARRSLSWLETVFRREPIERWDPALHVAFVKLLEGPHVRAALELLDHVGGWPALLPELAPVRGRAQYDPYHRYTVDGHLFVTVAAIGSALQQDPIAQQAAEEAGDLTGLRLAALLHDVGKGSGKDHSVVGERIARAACARMTLDARAIEEVAALVRHHLLFVDTATRRDLDDGAVIESAAEVVGDARLARLLYILTIADGRATGPEGWSDWKAALVRDLYRKVVVALETGEIPTRSDLIERAREVEALETSLAGRAQELLETLPHSYLASTPVEDMADELRLLLQPPQLGQVRCRVLEGPGESAIAVCLPDRPGTLARTAGVLALNRVDVLRAQAFSTTTGLAVERFVVRPAEPGAFERVVADLEAAYSGRLALDARLERKIADYSLGGHLGVEVRVLQDASPHSTVVEVRGPDRLGLLYSLAAALSDLDLDIHVAKIDTLGERVVDVFYVRTAWGTKLSEDQAAEVERSIRHRVDRAFNR